MHRNTIDVSNNIISSTASTGSVEGRRDQNFLSLYKAENNHNSMEQQYNYFIPVSSDQEIYNRNNNLITFPLVEDYERIQSDLQENDFHNDVYNNEVVSPLQQNPSSVVLNFNWSENHTITNFSPLTQSMDPSSSMQTSDDDPKRSKKMVSFKSNDNFGQRTSQYRGVTRYVYQYMHELYHDIYRRAGWQDGSLVSFFSRHRWTGRYEAHLWDNSCRKEGQTRKGRQGNYHSINSMIIIYDMDI